MDAGAQRGAVSRLEFERSFLSQPLVQAVLRELGEQQPATLLDDLLADVRQRLVMPAEATRTEHND
jgi:hypothetical protein